MKDNIFYLDWNTQKLFGSENCKSDMVIDSIIRGIEAGDNFPPVSVYADPKVPNMFYISNASRDSRRPTDGGHYRALGHYIADTPLKCRLLKSKLPKSRDDCIEIPNIIIVDNFNEYLWRVNRFPNYR